MLDFQADPLADRGQDEVIAAPHFGRDRVGEYRMFAAGQNGNRLGPERLAHKAIRQGRFVELAYDEIDLARREQWQQVAGAPLLQPHPDLWINCLEPTERARQDAGRRHGQGSERNRAATWACKLVELVIEPT